MIENVIFDWSGTLADDVDLTFHATNGTLTQLGGEPIDRETYRREFKIPVMGFYGTRLPGRSLDEVDGVFFDEYEKRLDDVVLFDGAASVLHCLAARGVRLFILSTVPNRYLDRLLARHGLTDLIEEVVGGAFDKSKYLADLLRRRNLAHDRTLFIGDTAHDIEVGRIAGVRTAAALWGYAPREMLEAEAPDDLLETMADLQAMLDRDHLLETVPLVIPTVGGVLVDDEGKLLLVRTLKWSGTWGIPGGKIQYGETMEAAYEREIKEETGLDVEDTRFVMIQDCIESTEFVKPRHFLLINYLSRALETDRLAWNYEIEEARWVTRDEARTLPLNEPTRIVLDEIDRLGLWERSR
ncbi:MAG TPA: NUDIX domain-containing protein [Planctomycetes bacterium]|nr:NUDIX domain-containing protein [Planctomycetota bacterium]